MSLSLDDKLLGEKTHYYCSSSEDEADSNSDSEQPENGASRKEPTFIPEAEIRDYNGQCTNTGPKGVIQDWREFKRLETEQRESQEQERLALAQKLSLTCRSYLDDENEKAKDEEFLEIIDLEDEFLKEYRRKRLEEMRKALENLPKFGKVISLSSGTFVDAIDSEKPIVTIIVHVYQDGVQACDSMNGCLSCLAQEYPTIKFCKLRATEARLSFKFAENGVPALLIYKNKEMLGNFIRLSDELGDDFFATDVESFLQEHSYLPSNLKDLNKIIKDQTTGEIRGTLPEDEDSGSDFEVD